MPSGERGICVHLGSQTGWRECESCAGKTRFKVFACDAGHGQVTLTDCQTCPDYKSQPALQIG